MKPYTNIHGKASLVLFWGDKLKRKSKNRFKKSARQLAKKAVRVDLNGLPNI